MTEGPAPARRLPKPPPGIASPFLHRILGAIFLRRDLYDAVAAEHDAWRPAVALVCLAAMAQLGVRPPSATELSVVEQIGTWSLPLFLILALARWVAYAAILYGTARLLAGPSARFGRLLRCLGFAEAPAILVVLCLFFEVDIHFFAWVQVIISLWLLGATIVAVRAALATTTARAAPIGAIGFFVYLALPILFQVFFASVVG